METNKKIKWPPPPSWGKAPRGKKHADRQAQISKICKNSEEVLGLVVKLFAELERSEERGLDADAVRIDELSSELRAKDLARYEALQKLQKAEQANNSLELKLLRTEEKRASAEEELRKAKEISKPFDRSKLMALVVGDQLKKVRESILMAASSGKYFVSWPEDEICREVLRELETEGFSFSLASENRPYNSALRVGTSLTVSVVVIKWATSPVARASDKPLSLSSEEEKK
jgi:hypothetical protein